MAQGTGGHARPVPDLTPTLPRLHAVTDDTVLARPDFLERVAAIAASGPVAVHVRGTLPGRALAEVAAEVRAVVARSPSWLMVNDRADVALATDAHGVHLPERGLPTEAARRFMGGTRWIGRSLHAPADIAPAFGDGADYVFLGPIFPTESHPDRGAVGVDALRGHDGPVIAIGGITPERAAACIACGAYGVAAVRALWHAPDPGAAAAAFLLSFTA